MCPVRGFQRNVCPCSAEVKSSPLGMKATCASHWPLRRGYERLQMVRPVEGSSNKRLSATGVSEAGEAIESETAIRLPSGAKASDAVGEGGGGTTPRQESRSRAVRRATSIA